VAEKADFEASLRKINMELANKNGMSRFISDVIQIWLVFIFLASTVFCNKNGKNMSGFSNEII
jgi:hypothetical protein